ncbi:transposable element Tcb1 transposase [Trichonephila clavipes]|nr:transposable element Tcb1 transposase [Trichonephila clavipes]
MEYSERWRAVGLIEVGQSITEVALFFGVHHSVISRLWKQFQSTQTVVRRPVGGRPRVTTPVEDRYIAIVAKQNYRVTSTRVISMVAASIGYSTDLHIFKRGSVTAVRYRDEILEPIVRLYAATFGPTFVLMDDNARPHRTGIVDDYMESEGIARMAWPDLNPIENLWDALGRAVSSRFPHPTTLIELEIALQEEWLLLNSAVADDLIESIVRRYDDNVCTTPIMADKDIFEFVQNQKITTDADSDDENEMNNAAPVSASSEVRNVMKSMLSYLNAHSNGEMNSKINDSEQFDAEKQCKENIRLFSKKSINVLFFKEFEKILY